MSNNYFMAGGKITDFSFFAWGAMLALWGAALWNCYCREKPFLLMFALAATAVTAVFDCCRLLVYTEGQECYTVIYALMAAELALFAGMVYLRRREAAELFLGSLILSYFGVIFILPQLCPLRYIYMFAGVYALLWLIYRKTGEKAALCIAGISMAGVILIAGGVGVMMYLRLPGIRFYEAKITEPAKEVKVSIVIPVYNAEKVIERCLDSLRRQTLKDIEIIAVNDGSTDGTAEILARYAAHDARIRVIHQKNAYIGTARNRGLKAARGEYVGFVDNDDYVSPDYYEALYKAAKKQNADVAVTKSAQSVWQSKSFFMNVSGKKAEYVDSKEILDLAKTYSGFVWTKLYKKDFLLGNNILFATERTLWEDTFFTLELYLFVDEMAVADSGTYFHTIKERRTASSSGVKFSDELFEMMTRLKDVIRTAPTDESKRQKISAMYNKYLKRNLLGYYRVLSEEDKPQFVARCEPFFGVEQCAAAVEEYNRKYEAKGN